MQVQTYQIRAFTKDGNGGNHAGVVLAAEALNSQQMQEIAKKVGYSETAFVIKRLRNQLNMRFFTPTDEIDLCGHATIGAFSVLRQLDHISGEYWNLHTHSGNLDILLKPDGSVFMAQPTPQYGALIADEAIYHSLGLSLLDRPDDLLPQRVFTGLWDIIVPVKNRHSLMRITPNLEMIKALSKHHHVVGYHVFCLSDDDYMAHCRNFAPRYGISEEPATGTSNAALIAYLNQHGYAKTSHSPYTILQGESLNNVSEIIVQYKTEQDKISEIFVGGHTSTYRCMTVNLI